MISSFSGLEILEIRQKINKESKQQDPNKGGLKIDVTHQFDNDLLLRQAQWRSFGTRPVKK